ncbi:unnamed protein product [Diamesa serratosioi]
MFYRKPKLTPGIHQEKFLGNYTCYICGARFVKTKNLRVHIGRHTKEMHEKCAHCDIVMHRGDLAKHIIMKHTEDRPFKCQVPGCASTFKLPYLLTNHIRRHSKYSSAKCQKCKQILNLENPQDHVCKASTKPKCFYCGKKMNSELLCEHIEKVHQIVIPNPHATCFICMKQCGNEAELRSHMKTCRCQHFCIVCGRAFKVLEKMEAHAKTHEHEKADDRKFPCEQCDLKFKTKPNVFQHMRRRHSLGVAEQIFKIIHECSECENHFRKRDNLKHHLLKYHQINVEFIEITCILCQPHQQYSTVQAYSDHNQEHKRIFECQSVNCRRKFQSKKAVVDHEKCHDPANGNEFKCHLCEKSFTKKKNLNSHISHHKLKAHNEFNKKVPENSSNEESADSLDDFIKNENERI